MMHIRLGTKILLLAIKSILLYILDSEVKLAWAAFLPQNNPSNIRKFAHIHIMKNDQWQQNSNSSSNQNNQHNLLITSNGNDSSKEHYYNLSNLHIKSNNSHPYSILLDNLKSCTLSSTTDLLSMDDIIRLLTYLKKIKTRIKTLSSSHISSILSSLQTNLEISFQHVIVLNGESSRSSNMHISQLGRHYQYLSLLYFLRLYTNLIKSCNLPNTTTINTNSDNQNSLSQAHSMCPWEDESSLFYFDKMTHIYRHSLKSLFHDHRCINQWSGIQRTSVHHGPNTLSPFQENDSLIANFLASSIPDLTNINSKPPLINTFSSAIISPPPQAVIVTEELKNRPNPPLHFQHTTSTTFINNNANDEWTFNTDTQLYPVPLTTPHTTIISDSSNWNPKPANYYYDYSTATSTNSPIRYPSNSHPPSEVLINYPTTKSTYPYWQTPTNNYPTYPPSKPSWHPNPYPPIDTGQLQLNFPPLEATTSPASPSPPVFIEPIVVSSPDQLPPNYHLPQGDTVLGHNPVSVVVGDGPPEIVILHDIVFSQPSDVGGEEVEGTTIGNNSESMTTTMQENEEEQDIITTTEMEITTEENNNSTLSDSQSGGGSSSAAGNSAAAAAVLAAGVGAGAAGLLGGAAAGAIAAGATGAAAIAANAADDGDDDATVAGSDIVDAAAASLDDAIAYSPAVTSDSDFEAMASEMEDLLADLFSYGVVRTIGMAIYSMVLPHVSFLLTSGLTIISFFFPWLYPHIIEPSVDFMVNLV